MRELIITKNDSGQRLDKFLQKKFKTMPKSMMYMYIRKKCIKLNGKKPDKDVYLKDGDVLKFFIKDEFFIDAEKNSENYEFLKAPSQLDIVYEDSNLILIDKKVGVLCHQDKKYEPDCLVFRVMHYLYNKKEYNPKDENSFTPALANRIDRNTGGIVIACKNAEALRIMNKKIRDREIDKYYLCLLINRPKLKEGTLSDYLIKNKTLNKVTVLKKPTEESKEIITQYKILETNDGLSLCEVHLLTGRTHQIRAHMASIGCPLLGDDKYGNKEVNKRYGVKRQCLYSYKLKFSFTTDSGILDYLKNKEFSTNDIWFMN